MKGLDALQWTCDLSRVYSLYLRSMCAQDNVGCKVGKMLDGWIHGINMYSISLKFNKLSKSIDGPLHYFRLLH